MASLKKYIMAGKRNIPRGATQRVADFLSAKMGVNIRHEKAERLIRGIEKPSAALASAIQDFIASRSPFSANKTGPKPKK